MRRVPVHIGPASTALQVKAAKLVATARFSVPWVSSGACPRHIRHAVATTIALLSEAGMSATISREQRRSVCSMTQEPLQDRPAENADPSVDLQELFAVGAFFDKSSDGGALSGSHGHRSAQERPYRPTDR